MFWKILKIEPTTDKKKIKAAYRDLLSDVNPEDKPEEFKALRQAYEDALAWADGHAQDTARTPMELWQEELAAVYDDFSRRNELTEWQKLLNEDICLSLDGRMACEDALLQFLMDHYFLSHEIWVYLDSQFSWLERKEELYDSYPQDFIDYIVVNGIHFNDTLPMKMFIPGKDGDACSTYLEKYFQFLNAEDGPPAKHPKVCCRIPNSILTVLPESCSIRSIKAIRLPKTNCLPCRKNILRILRSDC